MPRQNWILNVVVLISLLLSSALVFAWPVPDTGQTKCYDDAGNEIACPQPNEAFYGQDGNYTINPPSYTKLDANGNVLPNSATSWVPGRSPPSWLPPWSLAASSTPSRTKRAPALFGP